MTHIKHLLLTLAISCTSIAAYAKDWSKETLSAVQQAAEQGDAQAQGELGCSGLIVQI